MYVCMHVYVQDFCAAGNMMPLHNDTGLLLQQLQNRFLFDENRQNLILAGSNRTIFHDLAIADPAKIQNAIAFNFVLSQTEIVQAHSNIPHGDSKYTYVSGIRWSDNHGWSTSDYLIAKGAMNSLLMVCVWEMTECSYRDRSADEKLPSIDFSWIPELAFMCRGVLKQIPPELSKTLGCKDWPAAGKSPRELAHDLGHGDIVQLIDFIQFHEKASSLLSYVGSEAAFTDDSFAAVKVKAKTFSDLVEAGPANSK